MGLSSEAPLEHQEKGGENEIKAAKSSRTPLLSPHTCLFQGHSKGMDIWGLGLMLQSPEAEMKFQQHPIIYRVKGGRKRRKEEKEGGRKRGKDISRQTVRVTNLTVQRSFGVEKS